MKWPIVILIAAAISHTSATDLKPRTTNVNTNYNNNYNSNLDILFIRLVNYLTEVLTVLQRKGHLPRGEKESMSNIQELAQFPSLPSLFLDPSFAHAPPEEDREEIEEPELNEAKFLLPSAFPSAENVNININKNQNSNFNLLYDYLINYILSYQKTQQVSNLLTINEKPERLHAASTGSKKRPAFVLTEGPKQVDDTPEVKEAKRVFQKAYDEAKLRVSQSKGKSS